MPDIEQLKTIKDIHTQTLLDKQNVIGVAIGYKYVNGVKTNELSIIADVSQKVPVESLNPEDIVPSQFDGITTDVIETGSINALVYDPTQKFRPAPGGVSIGHKDVIAGTLGITVLQNPKSMIEPGESFISVNDVILGWPISSVTQKDEIYILSNNHVLANSNDAQIGDAIYQPGPFDGGTSEDTIAQLSAFVLIKFGWPSEVNKVDAALANPININDVTPKEILEIGQVENTIEAVLDMPVRKYGRTTQLTSGIVTQIYATVDVGGYSGGRTARFEEQIITTIMSDGGDSGNLLVEESGQRAVGLLFAGSSTVTVHNRIANVEEALGITL